MQRRFIVIELSRSLLRRFGAVLRRCGPAAEFRGSGPWVVLRAGREGLTLHTRLPEVAAGLELLPVPGKAELAVTWSALGSLVGKGDDAVRLEPADAQHWQASWAEGGVSRSVTLAVAEPGPHMDFPPGPIRWASAGDGFFRALHDAGRTTAKEGVRYALSRILLRGRTGQIVATDGRQLLVQGGFRFPWTEDLLVPHVPVWDSRELPHEDRVEVGQGDDHIFIRVGPWTFALRIDRTSKFAPFEQVLPRERNKYNRLELDAQGVRKMLDELPQLPGQDDEHAPVTLDLDKVVRVHARDDTGGTVRSLRLAGSRWTGSVLRLATDRHYLTRLSPQPQPFDKEGVLLSHG
jgi:hypothetical protein